ncbi:MAG: bifunctional aldehyde dehydrogenase/enoyl-CoA hydratase [Smithella sp. PtaU1.Bin162]|nr:MAG: bifunctional aldehyde dehydrogenase/enoyl-CoA hydratase [Smithella sp. PtaU1.Bin162]
MFYEQVEIGKVYKSEIRKPITGTEIDIVAQLSGMDLPGFLDAEHAKKYGFKNRVTPGPYIFACLIGLMAKQGFLADAVLMGVKEISFLMPVFPGDKLQAEVEVLSKKESKKGGGPVTYKWRIFKEEGLVAEGTNTCLFPGQNPRV